MQSKSFMNSNTKQPHPRVGRSASRGDDPLASPRGRNKSVGAAIRLFDNNAFANKNTDPGDAQLRRQHVVSSYKNGSTAVKQTQTNVSAEPRSQRSGPDSASNNVNLALQSRVSSSSNGKGLFEARKSSTIGKVVPSSLSPPKSPMIRKKTSHDFLSKPNGGESPLSPSSKPVGKSRISSLGTTSPRHRSKSAAPRPGQITEKRNISTKETNIDVSQKNETTLVSAKNTLRQSLQSKKLDGNGLAAGDQKIDTLVEAITDRLLSNKKLKVQVTALLDRIQSANGKQEMRRLSLRDNDIVTSIVKAMHNDLSMTSISVDADERFCSIKKSLVIEFADSLQSNFFLTTLKCRGVELGNDFLSALAESMETNLALENLDLSRNAFTSEALVEFCHSMRFNQTLLMVELSEQTAAIFESAEKEIIESLRLNTTLQKLRIDVSTERAKRMIKEICQRNMNDIRKVDKDSKLLEHLSQQAQTAEELFKLNQADKDTSEISAGEWQHLYELAELARKYKVDSGLVDEVNASTDTSRQTTGLQLDNRSNSMKAVLMGSLLAEAMTEDGAFLTNDFISKFLIEEADGGSLTFAFNGQYKMMKKFDVGHPSRQRIVSKFVKVLLHHPRAVDIVHLNMTNSYCGNDWVQMLSETCLEDKSLLPNLNLLSLETNYITDAGTLALSQCLADGRTWTRLQSVKLENQRCAVGNRKGQLSSKTELELTKALCANHTLIRLSLRIRNLAERNKINFYIARNMDLLRQARQKQLEMSGRLVEKPRNELEKQIDLIGISDPDIKRFEAIGDRRFLSLSRSDVLKLAQSFAVNTHVKEVILNRLHLDDEFAVLLARSLRTNHTIERLNLDGNAFSGEGVRAIVSSLSINKTIKELQVRHQTKVMASDDESQLAALVEGNATILKLGIDVRSPMVRTELDRITTTNHDLQRQSRRTAAVGTQMSGKRSAMEVLFEKIAANDHTITSVEIIGDVRFTSLSNGSRLEVARSFLSNQYVIAVKLNRLELDDDFATAIAASLEINATLQTLHLDSNNIGGQGIKSLFKSIARNQTLDELQLRHQSKSMSSSDEELLLDLIGGNSSITKVGVDVRSPLIKARLDQLVVRNREARRRKSRKSEA